MSDRFSHRIGNRGRAGTAVARVGLPCFDLAGQQRVARSVRNARQRKIAIRTEDSVAAGMRRGVVDHPRSHIEAVVRGVEERLAGTRVANFCAARVAGALERRDANVADRDLSVTGVLEVDEVAYRLLLHEGHHLPMNTPTDVRARGRRVIELNTGWQVLLRAFVVERGDTELLEVVFASVAASRLARGLNRREKQGDQNADDGNDHQQFDKREGREATVSARTSHANGVRSKMKGVGDDNLRVESSLSCN